MITFIYYLFKGNDTRQYEVEAANTLDLIVQLLLAMALLLR